MPPAHLTNLFADAMQRLGPFESRPSLAVAVSGGADSTALAILANDWVRQRQGQIEALVVDHALRPASAGEARLTIERLASRGIPARLLTLQDLPRGPAMAERARIARYHALIQACHEAGILHLLLGHHAADQVETLAMRVLRGSQNHGLAAMPALRETTHIRLLRPLLNADPADFRAFLTAQAIGWVEDPSNQDTTALRPRLRQRLPPATPALRHAIATAGHARARDDIAIAAELAQRVTIRPEGFALLTPGRIAEAALSRLIQTIGAAAYPPSPALIAPLAAEPRPATLAGVRIAPAGRLGPGWLVLRQEAAIGPPVPSVDGATWDNRFRLRTRTQGEIAPLGDDARQFRRLSDLPSAVLRTLPAIRNGKNLAEVPHLGYGVTHDNDGTVVRFTPPVPIAGPGFVPMELTEP